MFQTPPWTGLATGVAVLCGMTLLGIIIPHPNYSRTIHVAFLGNSMQYYNDFPRFMEELSYGRIVQNSCLHASATLTSILTTGNGMFIKWKTENAYIDAENFDGTIFDFGACTARQLLFGADDDLWDFYARDDDDNGDDNENGGLYNDMTNPCLQNYDYLLYLKDYYAQNPPSWKFVVMNDQTRAPGRYEKREESLATLESTYLPWLLESGTTPVFLDTHAYWSDERTVGDFVDVPTFTSLTYAGYREYAELLKESLPTRQKPRIAPVGIAFLTVWEEDRDMWDKLFHTDLVHASPHGTFLQGCVVHHTLFRRMPFRAVALQEDMSVLWTRARRMQPVDDPTMPMPTLEEATYLYEVASKVVKGYRPTSFVEY